MGPMLKADPQPVPLAGGVRGSYGTQAQGYAGLCPLGGGGILEESKSLLI